MHGVPEVSVLLDAREVRLEAGGGLKTLSVQP
jgi:hypothetical protein